MGQEFRSGLFGWYWLWVAYEILTKILQLQLYEGLPEPGQLDSKISHSRGCDMCAGLWQDTSVPCHIDFSTGLLWGPHNMAFRDPKKARWKPCLVFQPQKPQDHVHIISLITQRSTMQYAYTVSVPEYEYEEATIIGGHLGFQLPYKGTARTCSLLWLAFRLPTFLSHWGPMSHPLLNLLDIQWNKQYSIGTWQVPNQYKSHEWRDESVNSWVIFIIMSMGVRDWMFVFMTPPLPAKFICWSPNHQCDGIWKWDL